MEYLLCKGVSRFSSGIVTTLDKVFDFMWSSLNNTEYQKFAKTFFADVQSGKYSNYVIFDRKDNNRAFYKIV